MLEFIQILKQRYQSILAYFSYQLPQSIEYQLRIEQLIYAEAFMRKGHILETQQDFPLQIAVIGPTQVGKSSVVNMLLASKAAGVSPLAGYTVHPHGFCHDRSIAECNGLQNYFGRFQQLAKDQLSRQRYDCYSLSEQTNQSPLLPASVIWDTPDFDSIDAADYKEGVIRTIALADIVILVVSKEKYADQSVWDMMSIIESLNQPTLICLNKLTEGSEDFIVPSLQDKWRQVRSDAFPDVATLYYDKQRGGPEWPTSQQGIFVSLQKRVLRQQHGANLQQLLSSYWPLWLEPVYVEREAVESWHNLVEQSIERALEDYQRDYLNHPHHNQTFQQALVELLNLLEIPGIAKVLGKTRRAMTWPIRKVLGVGKRISRESPIDEVTILNQIAEHVLIELSDQLLDRTGHDVIATEWWKDVGAVLRKQKNKLLRQFEQHSLEYQENFHQDVEATARSLYLKLQEQPVLLNTLRAARTSTDAAALALVITTGGIGLHDLVITPAMLSVTSLLTESAVGGYLNRAEVELKQHQLHTVKTVLFEQQLKLALCKIIHQLPENKNFNISPQQLQNAEQSLKEKKHGLRLL